MVVPRLRRAARPQKREVRTHHRDLAQRRQERKPLAWAEAGSLPDYLNRQVPGCVNAVVIVDPLTFPLSSL